MYKVKRLTLNILYIFALGCLDSCKTPPAILPGRFVSNGCSNNENEMCRIYEREMIIAVDQKEVLGESIRNGTYYYWNWDRPVKMDIVFEVIDSCRVLSKLYENSQFTVAYPQVFVQCDTLKIFSKNMSKIYHSVRNAKDGSLSCFLEMLSKKDSTSCINNLFVVSDKKFGEYLMEIERLRLENFFDQLPEQGNLSYNLQNRIAANINYYNNGHFFGHVYRTYKVKMKYVYVGRQNYYIPNFGMLQGDTYSINKTCNQYVVIDIKSVEPISLKSHIFYPE
ncbi:MAG: hypothetical protein IPK11_10610 [Ignavibacteria bacterium]|nr:hypothetical protein [Ignavibacteria bacterium]